MSSWIIEDKTINKIVNFLVTCSYSEEEYKPEVTRIINSFGYDLNYNNEEKNPDANNLGQRMKVLNKKAWNYRYNRKGSFDLFSFDDTINEYDIYQILKHLQCFIYQCSEGEMIKDKLYLTFVKIESVLSNYILSNLEEYKKAKWE